MFSRLRTFVLHFRRTRPDARLVESERPRFESIGWMILVTSGIAAVSMWFALSTAMGSMESRHPACLAMGLVIMASTAGW